MCQTCEQENPAFRPKRLRRGKQGFHLLKSLPIYVEQPRREATPFPHFRRRGELCRIYGCVVLSVFSQHPRNRFDFACNRETRQNRKFHSRGDSRLFDGTHNRLTDIGSHHSVYAIVNIQVRILEKFDLAIFPFDMLSNLFDFLNAYICSNFIDNLKIA